MTSKVRLTREAEVELDRLFDFVLERELERDCGDLSLAEQAVAAIRAGFATSGQKTGWTCPLISEPEKR